MSGDGGGKGYLERPDIPTIQQQKLLHILPYVCSTPFYGAKLASLLDDLTCNPWTAFDEIPFTYKSDLRATHPMHRTPLEVGDLLAFFSSSGTTGKPSVYAWSQADQETAEKVGSRFLRNLELGPGDVALLPLAMGTTLSWYAMMSEARAAGMAVVTLGAVPLDRIAQALVDYPITVLKAPPAIASRLSRFIMENEPRLLSNTRLRQVHLAGHYCSQSRRRRLEEQWQVPCYSLYGMSEIGVLAAECSSRTGMHFCADYVLAEIMDPETQQPVAPGQEGIAVYTPLWKKAAPLLRYWSDDWIAVEPVPCNCGLPLPQIAFRGRTWDSIQLGGHRIFGSDLENVLLAESSIGDDFVVEVNGDDKSPTCAVYVEKLGADRRVGSRLARDLSDVLGAPVDLQVTSRDKLDKGGAKPTRFIDRRVTS